MGGSPVRIPPSYVEREIRFNSKIDASVSAKSVRCIQSDFEEWTDVCTTLTAVDPAWEHLTVSSTPSS